MTEKANNALSTVDTTKLDTDMYAIGILMSELETQKKGLEKAIKGDSYKGVNVSEQLIVDLCDAINKLRR